jgi:hypothetical protein
MNKNYCQQAFGSMAVEVVKSSEVLLLGINAGCQFCASKSASRQALNRS